MGIIKSCFVSVLFLTKDYSIMDWERGHKSSAIPLFGRWKYLQWEFWVTNNTCLNLANIWHQTFMPPSRPQVRSLWELVCYYFCLFNISVAVSVYNLNYILQFCFRPQYYRVHDPLLLLINGCLIIFHEVHNRCGCQLITFIMYFNSFVDTIQLGHDACLSLLIKYAAIFLHDL